MEIELKKLSEETIKIFKAENIEQLKDKILNCVLTNDYSKYYAFIDLVGDLSVDWLQKIFQYYYADRKEKKQDYTPKSLAKFVSKLTKTYSENVCLDLCAGSGALTIQKWNENKDLKFICKEIDENVIPFLLFNLAIRNIEAEVICADILSDAEFKMYKTSKGKEFASVEKTEIKELKADTCISNPPYNIKWDIPVFAGMQERFSFGVPPKSNANFAFLLTAIQEINQKASFILPNGVLDSQTVEENEIKKNLIKNNLIESVILCPNNMFESTNIPVCIITINKNKDTAGILFADLREKYETEERKQNGQFGGTSHTNRTYTKNINIIKDDIIEQTIESIKEKKSEAETYAFVDLEEIRNKEYSLRPNQYIQFVEREQTHREYKAIVQDINRIIQEKNNCKLTINETIAGKLGFDVDLYKQDHQNNKEFDELLEKIAEDKIIKHNYFTATKNKNELKFENGSKENISSVLMMILQMWKQHIYYLNTEENKYLSELRDALLPDLMSGKIPLE